MKYENNWENLIAKFGFGNITEREQYKYIVKIKAYVDMQPRTIKGLGKFREDSMNDGKINDLFNEIAEKLYSFVVKEDVKQQDKFNEWHKKICEKFTNNFNKIIEGNDVAEISFGKAQKIINVSLKYIYCLKGADDYVDKFKYCHMILDRYTYSEGFYKKVVVEWLLKLGKKSKKTLKPLKPWSNLEYKDYVEIQNNIIEYLKSDESKYINEKGEHLTPFQAEFYIFDEYSKIV